MGMFSGAEYVPIGNDELPSPRENHMRRVSVLPLVFLIFYEVSGGSCDDSGGNRTSVTMVEAVTMAVLVVTVKKMLVVVLNFW